MAARLIGVVVLIVGIAGLVLPVIPGLVLIALGLSFIINGRIRK